MDLATLNKEVESLVYYHPYLRSMEEVRSIMMDYIMQDGSFLLRNSFSKVGILTVTVMHGNSIKHFNLGMKEGCFCLQDHLFPSIKELVSFYRRNDVPNIEQVHHVRLVHPIPYTPSLRHRDSAPTPPAPRVGSTMIRSYSVASSSDSLQDDHTGQNGQRKASLQSNDPLLPQKKESRKSFLKRLLRKSPPRSNTLVLVPPEQPAPPPPAQLLMETESPYYSQVVNTEVDRVAELVYHLRQFEPEASDRCECGLSIEESELPNGWTMHISHDERTQGRLFFMGPNDETVWNLPFEVTLNLSMDQQDRIRDLMMGHTRSSTGSSNRSSNSSLGAAAPRLKPTEHECSSDDVNQI